MSKQQVDRYSNKAMKPCHAELSAILAQQIAEYEANGGEIEEVAHNVFGEDVLAKRPSRGKKK